MGTVRSLVSSLAMAFLLAACGSSSSAPPPPPPPTVDMVTPAAGSILGGTSITITGTNFFFVLQVSVGGNAASFGVTDFNTITCTTPPGAAPGSTDVAVTTTGGTASLAMAFSYFPPPTVTAVAGDRVATTGGRTVTITGTGFTANGAGGSNTVSVGGAAATAVVEVSDTELTCAVPAGTAGVADVVVSNANGMGTLVGGMTYVTPMLFAATARNNAQNQAGTFYSIDPANGNATMIGATGDVLTGLAFDPTFTTLFGLNTGPFTDQSIFTVDVATGATTLVGATGNPPNNNCGDITFVGATLVGNSWNSEFCSFDTTTGAGTLLGTNSAFQGLAIAADANQVLYLAYREPCELHTVDPANGATTLVGTLSGDVPGTEHLCALTFLGGVLYGVTNPGGSQTARLVSIDPATAVATFVGDLPNGIDALEGNVR